jgi:hypothetical protein
VPKSKPIAKPLEPRIAKARQEGRAQHALELTRQLYKQEPTEPHRELLRQVTLERGLDLQRGNYHKDAATLYVNALSLAGNPDFDATLASRLAACGELVEASALVERHAANAGLRARVLGQVADFAIQQGSAEGLPVELRPQFELVLRAFAASQAGRDDEARAALQGISLQSPFLEWKVFLRGLLAYYGDDDPRALENWQRLDPQRLPARLTVPFRFHIDPAYRQAQTPATQAALAQRSLGLLGSPLHETLEGLKLKLAQDNLAPAFRDAGKILPTLQRDYPALVPRLAACFFWAIVQQGQPEDIDRYQRVFGAPAEDPDLDRLRALATEANGAMEVAHEAWQDFLKNVAKNPQAWPAAISAHVQALVWARMGDNAVAQKRGSARSPRELMSFFFAEPPAAPLKPSAEECYRKSSQLVPERLAPQLALFKLHRDNKEPAAAKKVGQNLLKHFPEQVETLEALGDLALEDKDLKKAEDYFERALQANPLERRLRGKLAQIHQNRGLELTLGQDFEGARSQYQAALAFWDGPKGSLLCQRAVLEMKAGRASEADALVAQALAEPEQGLASRYTLLCEAVRAKLPPARRKELAAAFNAALAQAPAPPEILALLVVAARQRVERLDAFHGQKTRERELIKFLEQMPFTAFDEDQLERLAASLTALQARRPLESCLRSAERRFPRNPAFPLLWIDYYLAANHPENNAVDMKQKLEKARKLAETLPRGELQQQLLERIRQKEAQVQALCGNQLAGFGAMENIFMEMFGDIDEDIFDDEEDEE